MSFNIDKKGISNGIFSEAGPQSDKLIGWWPLNGDTYDVSDNMYDGINSGATIAAGLGQNCYQFDGTNDYINCGKIPLNSRGFSFSVWIANTKISNHSFILIQSDSMSSNKTLSIGRRDTNNKFTFAFYADNLNSSSDVTTGGTWQHWVGTYDSSNKSRKLYLNGNIDNSDTTNDDYLGTNADLLIGVYEGQSFDFSGKTQDIRIYDTALSASEVKILYNLTNPEQNQRVINKDNQLYTKKQFKENL